MSLGNKIWKGIEGVNAAASIFAAAAAVAAVVGIGQVKEENSALKQQMEELTTAFEAFTGVAADRAIEMLENGEARIDGFDAEAAEGVVRDRAAEEAGSVLQGYGDRLRGVLGGGDDAPVGPAAE